MAATQRSSGCHFCSSFLTAADNDRNRPSLRSVVADVAVDSLDFDSVTVPFGRLNSSGDGRWRGSPEAHY